MTMNNWSIALVVLLFALVPQPLMANEYPPLQPLIDQAEENSTFVIPPGTYAGPVIVDKPVILDGQNRVTIDAGGKGSVIVLDTDGATVRNLHLTNSGESHNDIDSGVQVRGRFNIVEENVIDNCLFGVDLQQSESNIVRRNRISSKPFELGQRGDAIRLWYSFDNKITDNIITDSRDTVVWYSEGNEILRNKSSNSRYSLHFMYSRYNLVEGNHYTNNTVGVFLMYSDSVVLRNNHIAHAAGPTGVGIGFKETSDLTIEGNEVLYCASGLYLDLSPFQPDTTNKFSHNLIAYNGIGVRFLNDWRGNIFEKNRFVDNLTQVMVSSGRTANNNEWKGNYWSDYQGFDKDQNGVGDSPYELYSYADRLWKDEPYAQFFKGSPMLEVLDFLERLAPFTEPNLLVRDALPSSQVDIKVVVRQEQVQEKDSLMLLRESLGR
ncbi:MAG: nitrous oxide reductase family maturation protein NosD [Gammaproteobacteria bacterium]|nr:MAG: nitrous oxide reductase family maturation protein NosD [Gammaproteobacteria bacterium]